MRSRCAVFAAFLCITVAPTCLAQWEPAEGPMATSWAKEVSPENVHPEYPRPQMVRDEWQNLNGLWDYAIRPKEEGLPGKFDGQILVPFAAESALSGVMKKVGEENRLWYRRNVEVARPGDGNRVLLNFGAVDWHAVVSVNGRKVGEHKGGYDPFTFDITDALDDGGKQELVVAVWDPTDSGTQPRGKQVKDPKGIWYTSVTGIWRTVWLETVPTAHIKRLEPVPDIDTGVLHLSVTGWGTAKSDLIRAVAGVDGKTVATAEGPIGGELELKIANPKLWSPDSPFLYDLTVTLQRSGKTVDRVESYFGMRKISIGKDARGLKRMFLNNEPLFHFGPLDQGWWPDGLYTAPTDEALKYDIEITKKLGFNAARKHVKIEPARWYYHCDRLGLLVWQDMPSGHLGKRPGEGWVGPADEEDWNRDEVSARQFEAELAALIDNYSCFPSIVIWVPFNEGWGQYDPGRIAQWIKDRDPTRLVNATSGWTDRGVGDIFDAHMYPGPGMEPADANRVTVLGEFGGLGLPVVGHLWWDKRNWGYRTYESFDELRGNYNTVVGNVYGMLGLGLSAAIYTQTTDVEGEVNGLMTYDREVVKFDFADASRVAARLYDRPPVSKILMDCSEFKPQLWRYTFEKPNSGWEKPGFDASGWSEGKAPFAWKKPDFFPLGTPWRTHEIWTRRSFTVDELPDKLWLKTFYLVGSVPEESATVYINGRPVAELNRLTRRHYHHIEISEHVNALKVGRNTIAIHANKPRGDRGIDAGIYGVWSD